MKSNNRSLLQIHIAVLLFGLAGLFAKIVNLPALLIVFGRVFFASLFLYSILMYCKKPIRLKCRADYIYIVVMGILLAIHWSTFFLSIQTSSVAIGLLAFSTFPVFITFLEPLFFNEKIKLASIAAAFITFFGIIFVVPQFELGNNITDGVLWGILSGFTYALLSLFNRKYVKNYSGIALAFYEQFTAVLVLLPFLLLQHAVITPKDILLLFILGIVFTGIAHTLFINGLKNITAQTASIISCLEPVYGILCAALLLHELPSSRELIGGIIILGTVCYSTITSK